MARGLKNARCESPYNVTGAPESESGSLGSRFICLASRHLSSTDRTDRYTGRFNGQTVSAAPLTRSPFARPARRIKQNKNDTSIRSLAFGCTHQRCRVPFFISVVLLFSLPMPGPIGIFTRGRTEVKLESFENESHSARPCSTRPSGGVTLFYVLLGICFV